MDILYAWLASIASGLEPLVIKASSKNLVKNPWLFNILWLAALLPMTMTYALISGGWLPKDWLSILGVAVCSAGFYALYTVSLYKIDVSTMAPLFSLRTVFSLLLGIVVLHEHISLLGWVLIAVILLASPFATYDEVLKFKAFRNRYVSLAILAMIMLAAMGYFVNISFHTNGFATTLLWQDILALILLSPALLHRSVRQEKITAKKILPFAFLGLMGLIYNASTIVAYGHNLAISSVIVSLPLSMLFVWVASRWYRDLLENHPPHVYVVRFAGAFLMVGSAMWLSMIY